MALKEPAHNPLTLRYSSALFLLLSLGMASSNLTTEKPVLAVVNDTVTILPVITQRGSTDGGARESKSLLAKNSLEAAARKVRVDPYTIWSTSSSSTVRPDKVDKETTSTTTPGSLFKGKIMAKHTSTRRKYPVQYTLYNNEEQQQQQQHQQQQQQQQDKHNSYSVSEGYEHQTHNYGTEYYNQNQEYEESYNTLPEEQNNNNLYEGIITDPWRVSYIEQDHGYFGPSIPPVADHAERDPPPVRECNCPSTTRSYECENPSNNFLTLITALGQNLWALIKLIAASSLPFIIPLLAIKIILVPLKILKILKLIKLFLKFFIILPFFVRVIYPFISNTFNLQELFFQKIQDIMPSGSHHPIHHKPTPIHPHELDDVDDSESRDGTNASLAFKNEDLFQDEPAMWDLRACPSRVACELGAFLSGSTYSHFPQSLTDFLARKADQADAKSDRSNGEGDQDGQEVGEDDAAQKNEAFKAFVVALGKRWVQDKCEIYRCSVLF